MPSTVNVGAPLTPRDLDTLAASWIDPATAEAARLRRVDNAEGAGIVGRNGHGDYAGIAIPNFLPGGDSPREWRLRLDHPPLEQSADGTTKETQKYLGPPGSRNQAYFPPGVTPEQLADTTIPIVICEGEKKCLALWRLAWHALPDSAEQPRFIPLGLPGVWNFRGVIGKAPGPKGDRRDVKGIISDFDRITWKHRRVFILFDANVSTNESVRLAREVLAKTLGRRGAEVRLIDLPERPGVNGVDDLLAIEGPDEVLKLFSQAADPARGLIVNREGDPKPILANAITLLRTDPAWNGVLAFNEFSNGVTAIRQPPWEGFRLRSEWTDHEDRLTTDWFQRNSVFVGVEIAGQAVQTVAKDRTFHPVREYLDSLKWDAQPRAAIWLSVYLGVEESAYSKAVGERYLIQAVARILKPGCKADCCIILEGPQGTKKSSALRALAEPWFTDEIADLGSKDAAMQTRDIWLIEIAELDSMSRAEVGRIKAFMSRAVDRFRPPYGKRLIDSPRQCVFAGSVNLDAYLRDETGARRFWPVKCGRIEVDAIVRDRNQLWAEAVHLFRQGRSWWLDSAELTEAAEQEQADRYEGDPWDEVIRPWLENPKPGYDGDGHEVGPFTATGQDISISDVLYHAIGKRKEHWTQPDKNRVGRCLRAAGWESYREPRLPGQGDKQRARRWRPKHPEAK